jgi:hypothetical protein
MATKETKENKMLSRAMSSVDLDSIPVDTNELAEVMGVSRWTIYRWRTEKNYKYQFGNLTTPGHLKAWLEENSEDLKRKSRHDKQKEAPEHKDVRLEAGLERMRL